MDELHRLQPSRALAGECRPTDPTHHAAGRQAGRQAETVGCSRAAGRALGRSVGSAAPRRKESAVDRGWAGVGVGVSGPAGAPSEGASARQPLSSLSATPDRTDIRPSERASEWLRLCLCAPGLRAARLRAEGARSDACAFSQGFAVRFGAPNQKACDESSGRRRNVRTRAHGL